MLNVYLSLFVFWLITNSNWETISLYRKKKSFHSLCIIQLCTFYSCSSALTVGWKTPKPNALRLRIFLCCIRAKRIYRLGVFEMDFVCKFFFVKIILHFDSLSIYEVKKNKTVRFFSRSRCINLIVWKVKTYSNAITSVCMVPITFFRACASFFFLAR